MKRKTGLIGAFLAVALVLQEAKAQVPPEQAARELVRRVLPASAILVEIISPDQGRDLFEIENSGDKIVLRGNNGVAVGSALNW